MHLGDDRQHIQRQDGFNPTIAADCSHLRDALLLQAQVAAANVTRLAVVATWGGSVRGVRRDLLPWMQIMTDLGVSHFYVRINSPSTLLFCD